jgi:Iap family predicted aminopeptidase
MIQDWKIGMKKIVKKKVNLFNPNNSPTPSPVKKVRKMFHDCYDVMYCEERINVDVTREKAKEKVVISTEGSSDQTPTITFLPRRPKRFCP